MATKTTMKIKIDGEWREVSRVFDGGYLPSIDLDDGTEWYVAESSEAAGKAARERWGDLVRDDPKEFSCLVGEETLISWALGQYAGPGITQVRSLEEWLDLWLNTPEEEFASYDGRECDVEAFSEDVEDAIGFAPAVAYRNN